MIEYLNGETGEPLVELTLDTALDCSQPGPADEAVADAVDFGEVNFVASADEIRQFLAGYGSWNDEELADDQENLHRVLWVAACDIRENPSDF